MNHNRRSFPTGPGGPKRRKTPSRGGKNLTTHTSNSNEANSKVSSTLREEFLPTFPMATVRSPNAYAGARPPAHFDRMHHIPKTPEPTPPRKPGETYVVRSPERDPVAADGGAGGEYVSPPRRGSPEREAEDPRGDYYVTTRLHAPPPSPPSPVRHRRQHDAAPGSPARPGRRLSFTSEDGSPDRPGRTG